MWVFGLLFLCRCSVVFRLVLEGGRFFNWCRFLLIVWFMKVMWNSIVV